MNFKKSFFLFFLLLSGHFAIAQNFTLGVKVVPIIYNTSNLVGTYHNLNYPAERIDYFGTNPFIHFGITSAYYLNSSFSIHSGVTYKEQGHTAQYNINWRIFEDKFRLKYIELPMLIRYRFGNYVKLFLEGGPSLKYLHQANCSRLKNEEEINYDVTSIYSPFVLTANLGIGCMIDFSFSKRLIFEGELLYGYDISQTVVPSRNVHMPTGDTWSFGDTHLVQMALTVGVSYRLGKLEKEGV